jgi:hypothetical protein
MSTKPRSSTEQLEGATVLKKIAREMIDRAVRALGHELHLPRGLWPKSEGVRQDKRERGIVDARKYINIPTQMSI